MLNVQLKKILRYKDLTGAGDLICWQVSYMGILNGKTSTKESLEKGTEMSSKIIQKIGARLI